MTRLTRKQRELREREALILRVAADMLVKDGYFGVSMDRIAEATEYAKGTIYQHFKSREDVIAGVAASCFEQRGEMLDRAATTSGRPRERLTAIVLADRRFGLERPEFSRVLSIIKNPAFEDRASEQRQLQIARSEEQNTGICMGVIRDAVSSGDLKLNRPRSEAGLLAGITALMYGWRLVEGGQPNDTPLLQCLGQLLDGAGWEPLGG